MKKLTTIGGGVVTALLLLALTTESASAVTARYLRPQQRAQATNWHANYAHTAYGKPVALVVPPTAQLQTNWSWGVGSSSISRIDHQFGRQFWGAVPNNGNLRYTPHWPSNMRQFGVYYVRGPWYPTQP